MTCGDTIFNCAEQVGYNIHVQKIGGEHFLSLFFSISDKTYINQDENDGVQRQGH